MTTGWLVGDRVACMGCDSVAYEVESVGPDEPLCPDGHREFAYDEEAA